FQPLPGLFFSSARLPLYVIPLRMSREKDVAFRAGVTYNGAMPKKKLPPEIRDYFVRMGRKGGALGGRIRATKLTAEERSESARKAVQARWARVKNAEGDQA